jgi:phage terminase large subunit-like protein
VHIEGGASYMAVIEHLEKLRLEYQSYFNVIEMSHLGKSKISRISALEPVVNAGRLIIVDVGDTSEQLVEQMELTTAEGCSAGHDDILDATSMAVRANLYYNGERVTNSRDEYLDAMEPQYEDSDLWN